MISDKSPYIECRYCEYQCKFRKIAEKSAQYDDEFVNSVFYYFRNGALDEVSSLCIKKAEDIMISKNYKDVAALSFCYFSISMNTLDIPDVMRRKIGRMVKSKIAKHLGKEFEMPPTPGIPTPAIRISEVAKVEPAKIKEKVKVKVSKAQLKAEAKVRALAEKEAIVKGKLDEKAKIKADKAAKAESAKLAKVKVKTEKVKTEKVEPAKDEAPKVVPADIINEWLRSDSEYMLNVDEIVEIDENLLQIKYLQGQLFSEQYFSEIFIKVLDSLVGKSGKILIKFEVRGIVPIPYENNMIIGMGKKDICALSIPGILSQDEDELSKQLLSFDSKKVDMDNWDSLMIVLNRDNILKKNIERSMFFKSPVEKKIPSIKVPIMLKSSELSEGLELIAKSFYSQKVSPTDLLIDTLEGIVMDMDYLKQEAPEEGIILSYMQEAEEIPEPSIKVPEPIIKVPVPEVVVSASKVKVPEPKVEVPAPKIEFPAPKVEVPKPSAEIPFKAMIQEPIPEASIPEKELVGEVWKPEEKIVGLNKYEDLPNYFVFIINQMDIAKGLDIAQYLWNVYNFILKEKGYMGVLDPIQRAGFALSDNFVSLSDSEKNELINKIKFWGQKLDIIIPHTLIEKAEVVEAPKIVEKKEVAIKTIDELAKFFDFVTKQVDRINGKQAASFLLKICDYIEYIKGYTGVIDNIKRSCGTFSGNSNQLTDNEKDDLYNKIEFWRQKLDIPTKEAAVIKVAKPAVVEEVREMEAEDEEIVQYFDEIKNELDTKTGIEISTLLKELHDNIMKTKGFMGILQNIKYNSFALENFPLVLTDSMKEELTSKMNFWIKKLSIEIQEAQPAPAVDVVKRIPFPEDVTDQYIQMHKEVRQIPRSSGRRKCPQCGNENRFRIKEIADRQHIISYSPLLYGKKYECSLCGTQWREN